MTFDNINAMWEDSAVRFRDYPVVHTRESRAIRTADGRIDERVDYHAVSFQELEELVADFGHGLLALGLQEQEGVALIAENSLRWLVCDLAVLSHRAYDVPRGCGASLKELAYILKSTHVRFAIVENQEQCDRIRTIQAELPELKVMIVLGQASGDARSFEQVLELGRPLRQREGRESPFYQRRDKTRPSDIATILYTSGTCGVPKGIPLTHANIMHNVNVLPEVMQLVPGRRFLAVLPIWHTFERTGEYSALRGGACIFYSTPATILKDMALVDPHHIIGVPRLWMAVRNMTRSVLRQAGKEKLFQALYACSLNVKKARRAGLGDRLGHALADLLFYRKIRAKFGRNFISAISGGGSLPEDVDDFFEIIGVPLLEGYGLTETSPVISGRTMDRRVPYTCGRPLPQTEVRIRDAQGRDLPAGEQGIVFVSGPQVMSGYYNDPKQTAQVMHKDEQGRVWFDTGDLGLLHPSGDLSIVGRVKDTIVLIGGENIEPGPIEEALSASDFIEQVMLCGQDQEYITALVVPDRKLLQDFCSSRAIAYSENRVPELSRDPRVQGFFGDIIARIVSPKNGFTEAERIVHFSFTRPFAMKDDTLSATYKVKRHAVLERDAALIRSLYPHYTELGAEKIHPRQEQPWKT